MEQPMSEHRIIRNGEILSVSFDLIDGEVRPVTSIRDLDRGDVVVVVGEIQTSGTGGYPRRDIDWTTSVATHIGPVEAYISSLHDGEDDPEADR